MSSTIAIVGRPNVGKSTLFNRLVESRDAIVDSTSGVTRDRHYGTAEWTGKSFSVIDTGGYTVNSEDAFEGAIRKQVELAIDESDLIVFMVDVTTGITDLDEAMANLLRKAKKPVMVVANKVDNHQKAPESAEFYSLGLGEVYAISANNGSGTGDLLDEILKNLPGDNPVEDPPDIPRLAVVGKPNVGKSSFINALTGQERNIVTNEAGTTRDSIHSRYNMYGFDFMLVDTAGIRKKRKVHENIEFYSILRSEKAIEESDVCLLVVDATEGIQKQDLSIFYQIEKHGKGVVILVNKWDLVEKDHQTVANYQRAIEERISPFHDVPILFISALNSQRIHRAIETAVNVYENRSQRITTSKLNAVMQEIIQKNPPPMYKGKAIRIKYVTQLPNKTPCFAFYCNLPQYIKPPYKRFLENQIRQHFNFTGVPIRILFKKK